VYTTTSFHSSAVPPDQISGIAADYLTLERARIHRRLCVTRFGLTAIALAAASALLQWPPASIAAPAIATCLAVSAWTRVLERRCEGRLERRLDEMSRKKVVKSS